MTGVSEAARRRAAAPAAAGGGAGVPGGRVHRGGQPWHAAAAHRPAGRPRVARRFAVGAHDHAAGRGGRTPVLGRLGDGRLRRRTTLGGVAFMLAGCRAVGAARRFRRVPGRAGAARCRDSAWCPLATAVARDDLPAGRSRPHDRADRRHHRCRASASATRWSGCSPSTWGSHAPFWFVAALSALALAAARRSCPPARPGVPPRLPGAVLLGLRDRRAAPRAGRGPGVGLGVGRPPWPARSASAALLAGLGRCRAAGPPPADRPAAAPAPAGARRQRHRVSGRRRVLPAGVAGRPLRADPARGGLRLRRVGRSWPG